MKTVYVVMATDGADYEREDWLIGVWEDRSEAEAEIGRLSAEEQVKVREAASNEERLLRAVKEARGPEYELNWISWETRAEIKRAHGIGDTFYRETFYYLEEVPFHGRDGD